MDIGCLLILASAFDLLAGCMRSAGQGQIVLESCSIGLGVRGSMEQGSQLRPVPVRKPACRLAGTIKPPFCETTSASTREGNNTPKIGSINSFSKSEFANPHHLKGLANSNHERSSARRSRFFG
ncbi:hypothetical protein ALP51_200146 [Pseudomonas savastanoi]|uniref:Uncharacterized protein n=1 Tax=Pseudomonas savastanoi TaxID=29438 RepID=A0A3M5KFR4_PSESS|nr:hypothetical protein ALP51_200146 [Pseudomonas savastanoi]